MNDDRLEEIRLMARRLTKNGTVNKRTMQKIDALADAQKIEEMTGAEIKALREREGISQSVLAVALNMSDESVKKWEQGKTRPQGAALRLLSIIDRNGLSAVI